jgi:hypothetical protein
MHKLRSTMLIPVVSLCLLGTLHVSTTPANAYTFSPHNNRLINPLNTQYSWGDYLSESNSSVIKTGWQDAISDWHNAQNKVRFKYSSSSSNKLHSMHNIDKSLFGRMTWTTNDDNLVTRFNGYINAYADHDDQKISDTNVAKSVGSHELGHVMGIHHVSGTSIMNDKRNRKTIYKPQSDDIKGINAIYDISIAGGE